MTTMRVTVAERSDVVRRGVMAILAGGTLPVALSEAATSEQLRNTMTMRPAAVLIVSPTLPGGMSVAQMRREWPAAKLVALQSSLSEGAVLNLYDESVSIYDTAESVVAKLRRLVEAPDAVRRPEPLSPREKDIIVCVIRGMTNRQIAEQLHLSPHTVNTHRRNISSKLDIHTTSGLTIYAISNRLVNLDELGGE